MDIETSLSFIRSEHSFNLHLTSFVFYILFFREESNMDVRPLISDREPSRFPPKTSISTIVKEVMVDQWNPSWSYDLYWHACAPTYCTYSQIVRTNNFIGVVATIVSMVGGLIVALRIIVSNIINLIFNLFTLSVKKQQKKQQEQQLQGNS